MLLDKHISENENAPVIVLFGGNPYRRDEVVRNLQTLGDVSIYGTLSEEEGIATIKGLPKVDLVLIGGRYSTVERRRIRKFVAENLPQAQITEPGLDYPYESEAIKSNIQIKLNLQ